MLIDQIKADSLAARKTKSAESGVLLTLIGEIQTREKTFDVGRIMTDDEIVAIVQKFLKNNQETQTAIQNSTNRDDEKVKLNLEKIALEKYLPQQLSKDDLIEIAMNVKGTGGNFGAVMKHLKDNFTGKYDGKMASTVVKEVMSS